LAGEQFNFRIDKSYYEKLKKTADKKETKPSSLAADIVKKSLDFWEKKRE
jgi:vacuolar-type H+-ATPase subunit C/Vma6